MNDEDEKHEDFKTLMNFFIISVYDFKIINFLKFAKNKNIKYKKYCFLINFNS